LALLYGGTVFIAFITNISAVIIETSIRLIQYHR
jgi:hypothetical protein